MGQSPPELMCRHTRTYTDAPSAQSLTSIYFPSPFPLPLSPAHFAELLGGYSHSKVPQRTRGAREGDGEGLERGEVRQSTVTFPSPLHLRPCVIEGWHAPWF